MPNPNHPVEPVEHTPGKWIYDDPIIRKNGVHIARIVQQITMKDEEAEANARLIAAAPKMLELLRAFIRGYDPTDSRHWFEQGQDWKNATHRLLTDLEAQK